LAALLGLTLSGPRLEAQHDHMSMGGPARRPSDGRSAPTGDAVILSRQFQENGIAVDLTIARSGGADSGARAILEGRDTEIWVSLRDAATGAPLSGQAMGTWIDRRPSADTTAADACHEKVEMYVQGQQQYRPAVDLTSFFVLALNNGNTISVIDPFIGFGSSKLYTTVRLPGPGEDWVLDDQHQRLYVTMPLINAVAVVRTEDWKVDATLAVGVRPTQIALAPDGSSLWVIDGGMGGAASGVTVLDPASGAVLARLETGTGAHALTFTDDGRLAFLTNQAKGSVTVIDAATRRKLRDVVTGAQPVGLAYSPVARAVYVAHRGAAGLVVLDAEQLTVRSRVRTGAGLTAVHFDQSGRWAFAVNAVTDSIYVVDARTGRTRHVFQFGRAPDQVSFTPNFAYVRSTGTVDIAMVNLASLEEGHQVQVQSFPAGELAPNKFGTAGTATAVSSSMASDPHMMDAVYVPNPADQSIYYYHYMEGMAIPSGRLNNYGFEPKAVLVSGRDLREHAPGSYGATFKAPDPGPYDLAVLLDQPRVLRCIGFMVEKDSGRKSTKPPQLRLEPLWVGGQLVAGDTITLRFRLIDAESHEIRSGVADLMVLLSSPTGWSEQSLASEVDNVYQVPTRLPAPGAYYLMVASRALRVRWQDQSPVTFVVPPHP
jgi:YVTN family beta-propeller protein